MNVLFVCLGNICRSPMAEGVLKKLLKENGIQENWNIDSCGTAAYHVGEPPDPRTLVTAKENGIILNHKGRRFQKVDWEKFDVIFAMDHSNFSNVLALKPESADLKKLQLIRKWDNERSSLDVPDPYYGNDEGFREVWQILYQSLGNWLGNIHKKTLTKNIR